MTSEEANGEVLQSLSFVGEWIEALCDYFGTSSIEISEKTGVTKQTMSRIIRGESLPSWETAEAIWLYFIEIAAQKRLSFSPLMSESFINAAGFVSANQTEIARSRLDMLQEFMRMRQALVEKDQQIAQMAIQLDIPIEDGIPQIPKSRRKRKRRPRSLDN